jgi:hypothetical protein
MAIEKATTLESPAQTFTRWLRDGQTWIACFENHDLGHRDVGRRITVPYDVTQYDLAVIGKSTAPDHRTIGLGWRYILKAKARTAGEALAFLESSTRNPEVK